MWSVIEQRLRARWPTVVSLYGCSWLLAWLGSKNWQWVGDAEGPALLAGVLALFFLRIMNATWSGFDAKEKRNVFHYALPLPRRQISAARIVEPLVLPLILTMLTLAIGIFLRWIIGGSLRLFPFALLVTTLGAFLFIEQLQVLGDEIKHRVANKGLWLGASVVVFGTLGVVVGLILGRWVGAVTLDPSWALSPVAGGQSTLAFLALAALSAVLNSRLLASRLLFTD